MNSKEICIWLDERWCDALEKQHGVTMEELLTEYAGQLTRQLPLEEQARIREELHQEDAQRAAEAEANRRFSVFRITEKGAVSTLEVEQNMNVLHAANHLRSYLKASPDTRGRFIEQIPGKREPLTATQFEQRTAALLRGDRRVTGVYDIDLGKGTFRSLDPATGWRAWRTKDVSAAAYFAMKMDHLDWVFRTSHFYHRLNGKELSTAGLDAAIRGDSPLPVESLRLSDEVSQMDGILNFYVHPDFDVDGVFGTHVCTDENEDWVNVYANYDLQRGCVCDVLDISLVRADGSEVSCAYRLSPKERAALLPKLDACCKVQTGMTLKETRAQYLDEEQAAASSPPLLSRVERERQDMHREVDARYDALVRKTVLGDESGSDRFVPMREDLSDLKGEKPSAVVFRDGSSIPVKTWRQAALVIMRDCCASPERRERLMELRGRLHGNLRTLLNDTPQGMDVPLEVTDGLYMEGKFDTGALFRMLTDKILPQAGYDYQGTMLQLRESELEQTREQAPVQGMGMSQTM